MFWFGQNDGGHFGYSKGECTSFVKDSDVYFTELFDDGSTFSDYSVMRSQVYARHNSNRRRQNQWARGRHNQYCQRKDTISRNSPR